MCNNIILVVYESNYIYKAGTRPALRSAIAGGVLWTVQAPQDSKGASQVYLRSMKELTTDIESREWLTLTMLAPAWFIFMERCFRACMKAEALKNTTSDQRAVADKVAQQLISELHAHRQKNSGVPVACMNITFALAGLAAALPESAYTRYEEIMDTLLKNIIVSTEAAATASTTTESVNDLVRYAAVVGLAHLGKSLHTTDSARLLSVIDLLKNCLLNDASEQVLVDLLFNILKIFYITGTIWSSVWLGDCK